LSRLSRAREMLAKLNYIRLKPDSRNPTLIISRSAMFL
jgi:hypothetical protein